MGYVEAIAATVAIYVMLASSFDLMASDGGIMMFGQSAMFGVGAYLAAAATTMYAWPPWAAVVVGALLTAFLAVVVFGRTSTGEMTRFIIATMAFMLAMQQLFSDLTVLGGSGGISNIPYIVPSYAGTSLILILCAIGTLALTKWLRSRRFWILMHATREDAVALETLGRSAASARVTVILLGCGVAGLAGALYATQFTYIDPTLFGQTTITSIVAMAVVGGRGSWLGPAVGAVILEGVPQTLTFLSLPVGLLGPAEVVMFAILILVVVFFWPKGLIRDRGDAIPRLARRGRG